MRASILLLVVSGVVLATGCRGGKTDRVYAIYTGGDAHRGAKVIRQYSCGSCHTIPGIHGANGEVGPPLTFFAKRTYIGGELPNNPDNLVRWIQSPKSVEPGTAMPALGLSEQDARDVAAYLYTLQ